MPEEIIAAIVTSVIAFFTVFFIIPILIKILQKNNLTVKDVNKKESVMIPRPGGPSIFAGILASELVLYIFIPMVEIIAIIIVTLLAFLVGMFSDVKRKNQRDMFFPAILLGLCAIPIILIGTYDTNLAFPLFGEVKIPILYLAIIIIMITITGNTINSIDVLNGVASGFMIIASFALTISLLLVQNYDIAIASLPLGFVSLAFYKYHKFPSKIFPGDSGAFVLGAMYGTIAIVGEVEIIAAIILLPAIINSFLYLSSWKHIRKQRQSMVEPVTHADDFKLKATSEKEAPITLVRLLLGKGESSEKDVASAIFKLTLFSGILGIITALMMGVTL